MRNWIACALALLVGCDRAGGKSGGDGGGADGGGVDGGGADGGGGDGGGLDGGGGDGGAGAWGGVALPWPVFDGTVPDVPPAAAPARTWYCDAKSGDDAHDGTSFATA